MPSQPTATAASTSGSGVPSASRKRRRTRRRPPLDADAGVARDHAVGTEALAHRREQHRLQVAAMDRELRHVVAGEAPSRLGVDELAEAIEERRLAGDDGALLERVEHAEPLQLGRSRAAAR